MRAAHPEAAPIAEDLDPGGCHRSLPIPPQRVVYRVRGDEVLIVRTRDSRRDPSGFAISTRVDAGDGGPH
ncbi:MAG: type II toxin-antitoxin system RelE/ParE family toxin [Deltaproteobacteria bacterium]|nr:type II toxin-antitoxin system RelE/ParE family toxin [Deltaproteobacteria bacterium]